MTAVEFNYQLINLESKLSNFAFSLTSNKPDAEDLVQETLLKAITYREQYAENTNLKAWTFTIMKNSFINNYRRSIRQKTTFDHSKDLYFLSRNIDSVNITPDSIYSATEISKVIDDLDPGIKIPFKLHLEGYKYYEISVKLNLKIGTVKSRIFYARKKLMELLKNYS